MASSVPSWSTNSSAEPLVSITSSSEKRVAGVGAARQLPDLPVEGVEPLLGLGGGLLRRRGGGLLPLQDDLGLVELLGDDLELVVGLGDELDGLLGGGRPVGVRGGGAREDGDRQGAPWRRSRRPERSRPRRREPVRPTRRSAGNCSRACVSTGVATSGGSPFLPLQPPTELADGFGLGRLALSPAHRRAGPTGELTPGLRWVPGSPSGARADAVGRFGGVQPRSPLCGRRPPGRTATTLRP